MTKTLLKVSGLKVSYGGIQAVKGVDFEVHEGELVSLIGSNGAGKTTTMKAITGTLPINAGDIEYLGKSIKGQGPWDLVKQGLAMVPEGRGVFTRMTIIENLQMGAYIRSDADGIAADMEKMFTIFPRLRERKDQLAGTMSGGEQQMLAMGRALMSRPKVLLLVSHHGGQNLRSCKRRLCTRCDGSLGRAKRQPCFVHCQSRLCHGVGHSDHDR
jgi:branched-chain amino acid transport system ATP-binding protein